MELEVTLAHSSRVSRQARGRNTRAILNPVFRKAKWVGMGHSRAGTARIEACWRTRRGSVKQEATQLVGW